MSCRVSYTVAVDGMFTLYMMALSSIRQMLYWVTA